MKQVTDYCCSNRFPLLHVIVISLLFGITLLIVGLVQLKPNADSEAKKFLFLYSAAACFATGFFFMFIRFYRRYKFRKRVTSTRRFQSDVSDYSILTNNTLESMDSDQDPTFDSMALIQQRF